MIDHLFPRTNLNTHYFIDSRGCWLWKGGIDPDGYGSMAHNRRAHRVYYERANGPIPKGMCVCHSCDNPSCVNPDHLFLGTPLENNDDKVRKKRHIYGERVPKSKLTESQVKEILMADEPCFILARRYSVSDATISYIKLGKTWKHISRPNGYKYAPYRAPGNHTKYEQKAAEFGIYVPSPNEPPMEEAR